MNRVACLMLWTFLAAASAMPAAEPPAPFGPLPRVRQLRWHEMEYYGFIHFTVNTFTDKEWGYGDEDPKIFNPTDLDPRQWAEVAKKAGMTGLIITAKHHDGFCLWPSKYTEHSVKNSPWKDGKGDVVAELAAACKANGLRMGVYLSPWDRNHADYGTPKYIEYYRNQMRELLTNYGDVFEVWFDGANGGDGYYGGARETRRIDNRTYYDWPNTWSIVRQLQPMATMFSDGGPDVRWVGNESGTGSETNWATLRRDEFLPGHADRDGLARGQADGTHWVPAEVDVSIRPGWFYHAHEDEKVKSVEKLVDIYYSSVGNGCTLLLNIPPDRRGRFHEIDCERLMGLRQVLDATFDRDLAAGKPATASNTRGNDLQFAAAKVTDGDRNTYWAADDDVRAAELVVELGAPTELNRVRVQEHIALGQRIESFAVDARVNGTWREIGQGTTIGPYRILRMPTVTADAVRLRITGSRACPTLSTLEVYLAP
ncbi:MAG: alpha-L-fucosidase [Patescibacteria group bacterium]|nr:alpha-L-fucosidase [Patescibacteria group bacterium]